MTDLVLVGPDNESDLVRDIAGSARIKSTPDGARFHEPRLFWRQLPVGFENVNTWAFEIEVDHDPSYNIDQSQLKGLSLSEVTEREAAGTIKTAARLHIAGFAFETSVATSGSPRGRIANRADR